MAYKKKGPRSLEGLSCKLPGRGSGGGEGCPERNTCVRIPQAEQNVPRAGCGVGDAAAFVICRVLRGARERRKRRRCCAAEIEIYVAGATCERNGEVRLSRRNEDAVENRAPSCARACQRTDSNAVAHACSKKRKHSDVAGDLLSRIGSHRRGDGCEACGQSGDEPGT